jgi:hypothetical protein
MQYPQPVRGSPIKENEMTELNYPKHAHPHGIDKPENAQRIWVCEDCACVFSDSEIRKDLSTKEWGHICKHPKNKKSLRCESHLESYVPG